jgi:biotin carboxyl carrier protein
MPTYETSICDKPLKVELTKKGENSFTVTIDGKLLAVHAPTDRINLEEPFSLNIDGKNYQIELPRIDREKPFQVKVDGTTFKAEIGMPAKKTAVASFAPNQPATVRKAVTREPVAEGAITAPMTGKIVSVKVQKGDHVKANQVVCIIEAMKMENEICAPKNGSIQQINVSEGSSVSEGDILLIID